MSFSAEFLLQLLIAIGSGAGVYAAIRADLARLNQQAKTTESVANHAHRRIDDHLQTHRP